MTKTIISPSLLSANYERLPDEVILLQNGGADWIHFDIMDGKFVPKVNFGFETVQSVLSVKKSVFDVHLMINQPENYVADFCKAGADIVTFHAEATDCPIRCIDVVRSFGKKVGISIKPDTQVDKYADLLKRVDYLLVMSVEPGYGGQKLIPSTLVKAKQAKAINPDILVGIDGGVNFENSKEIIASGFDVIVSGSCIFRSDDYGKAIDKLRSL